MPQRTESFDVDKTFDVGCEITKAYESGSRRIIRGVASGVLEDRDGERVSARAIAQMAGQSVRGMKVVAGTHEQNWTNEIGTVLKLEHDPTTDELIVECELDPTDPLADKAWKKMTVNGEKLGFSIGGKLRKAFFELAERGGRVVKRKVLDGIELRHMCLTEKPSYATSFAEAVGKTASDFVLDESVPFHDEPADREREDAAAIVAKAAKTPPADEDAPVDDAPAAPEAPQAGDDAPEGNEPGDDATSPPAGTADTSQTPEQAAPQAPSDAEQTQGLPMALRHLSCPNCGEEFAADLPADEPTNQTTTDKADDPDTGKTAREDDTTMSQALLDEIRALANKVEAHVEKTAAEAEPEVAKTPVAAEATDVERMIAAVHKNATDGITSIETKVTEDLNEVAKAVKTLSEQIASLPVGRRSVGSTLGVARAGEVEVGKTATDTDDVKKAVDEAPDALSALKAINAANGIA